MAAMSGPGRCRWGSRGIEARRGEPGEARRGDCGVGTVQDLAAISLSLRPRLCPQKVSSYKSQPVSFHFHFLFNSGSGKMAKIKS